MKGADVVNTKTCGRCGQRVGVATGGLACWMHAHLLLALLVLALIGAPNAAQ